MLFLYLIIRISYQMFYLIFPTFPDILFFLLLSIFYILFTLNLLLFFFSLYLDCFLFFIIWFLTLLYLFWLFLYLFCFLCLSELSPTLLLLTYTTCMSFMIISIECLTTINAYHSPRRTSTSSMALYLLFLQSNITVLTHKSNHPSDL